MCVQAEEAKTIGLIKVAKILDEQIYKRESITPADASVSIRSSDEFYIYASKDFKADVERNFWNAAISAADFYDKEFDAKEINELVEKAAQDFVDDLRIKMGVKHGIGAYEPNVPGETISGRVAIELSE